MSRIIGAWNILDVSAVLCTCTYVIPEKTNVLHCPPMVQYYFSVLFVAALPGDHSVTVADSLAVESKVKVNPTPYP